jgi:hypothetical protein
MNSDHSDVEAQGSSESLLSEERTTMNSGYSDVEAHSSELLPSEEEYTSLALAELAVKEHAMRCGYGLSRKKLVKDKKLGLSASG